MDKKPNQFTNTIPNILDGIGKICSVFAHRKEEDHSQIINALHESQRQYSLQLEKMNQFQKQMIEQFNKSPKRCYYQAQFLTTTIYNYK